MQSESQESCSTNVGDFKNITGKHRRDYRGKPRTVPDYCSFNSNSSRQLHLKVSEKILIIGDSLKARRINPSSTAVIILQPLNVILAEIRSSLDLDKNKFF
jgi:hypothetical protein